MTLIPSENFVFADLSVIDNLRLGGATPPTRRAGRAHGPHLRAVPDPRRSGADQLAGTMSGGQQRMLSLGIALMSQPASC